MWFNTRPMDLPRALLWPVLAALCIAGCDRGGHAGVADDGGAQSQQGDAVRVRLYQVVDRRFEPYTNNPSSTDARWMRDHYARIRAQSPYFDERVAWFPNAWVYKDAYGIRPDSSDFSAHPEWILHGLDGAPLYIPSDCREGVCPQYAGDFGNPDFRASWIADAGALLAKGYRGLWIDDVNLVWRVSDGNGRHVAPLDPRTGEPMTQAAWRRYLADFMVQVRGAFPAAEIVHNALWFADWKLDDSVQRQIDAADYVNLERGVNDRAVRGGNGRFGFDRMLAFIDLVHERGRHVILTDYGETPEQREYALAAWFLVQQGTDLLGSNQPEWTRPRHLWSGYTLDLGPVQGNPSAEQRVLRREYACGLVLLNEPDQPTRAIPLPATYTGLDGDAVDHVTLPAWGARVLLKPCARMNDDARNEHG